MFEWHDKLTELYDSMPEEDQRQWGQLTEHLVDSQREFPMFMPDLVIAPDGNPYLYRWYVTPRNKRVNMYFHIQVASDPERPLHDHPWDNASHILAGGYEEIIDPEPINQTYLGRRWATGLDRGRSSTQFRVFRKPGDVVRRSATDAHRLILPKDIPYTMSLFTTGPKLRDWGFWYLDGWHHNERHVADRNGRSIHVNR